MRRVMETTEISVIKDEIDPNAESDIASNDEHLIIPEDVEVYEINGPYFFGIATKFEESWHGWRPPADTHHPHAQVLSSTLRAYTT